MSTTPIQAVIFDFDGTILDTEWTPDPITGPSDLSEADLVLDSLAELPYAAFGLG